MKNVASVRCIVFKRKPISAERTNALPCLTLHENVLLYFKLRPGNFTFRCSKQPLKTIGLLIFSAGNMGSRKLSYYFILLANS